MSVEMVQAIGGLWPLALMIVLGSAIVVFRKQWRSILDEIVHLSFKRGETEIAMKRRDRETSANPAVQGVAHGKTEAVKDAPGEGWKFDRYFKASSEKNRSALGEEFERLRKAETVDSARLDIEAMHYYVLYANFGDGTALGKLRLLANREEADASMKRWLSMAYEKAGDHASAALAMEEAVKLCNDEVERAQFISTFALNNFAAGNKQESFDRLMTELGRINSREAASRLYECLASLYEKTGDGFMRALSLEKAIEGRPNDPVLRAQAAFQYEEEELSRLGLFHYKKQLEFHSEDHNSLNNIGVAYKKLAMPFRAVRCYKKASSLGNTLASANLAYIYINAGCELEAKELLDRAKASENHHQNVGRAVVALSESNLSEQEMEKRCLDDAREQQQFFSTFAEAALTQPKKPRVNSSLSLSGHWLLPDGTRFEVLEANGSFSGQWQSGESKHYFNARLNNRAFLGFIGYKDKYGFQKSERKIYGFFDPGSGRPSDGEGAHPG